MHMTLSKRDKVQIKAHKVILAVTRLNVETIPAVIERFWWSSKEIVFTYARRQQLGMEAEYVVTKIKKMHMESDQESGEGLKQLEIMVINAKEKEC